MNSTLSFVGKAVAGAAISFITVELLRAAKAKIQEAEEKKARDEREARYNGAR